MAMELSFIPYASEVYGSLRLGGDYCAIALALLDCFVKQGVRPLRVPVGVIGVRRPVCEDRGTAGPEGALGRR